MLRKLHAHFLHLQEVQRSKLLAEHPTSVRGSEVPLSKRRFVHEAENVAFVTSPQFQKGGCSRLHVRPVNMLLAEMKDTYSTFFLRWAPST